MKWLFIKVSADKIIDLQLAYEEKITDNTQQITETVF